MYARPVTLHIIKLLYINAMRRFMFTCAGTPLALPYQEFTKGMNPLAPDVYKRQGNHSVEKTHPIFYFCKTDGSRMLAELYRPVA